MSTCIRFRSVNAVCLKKLRLSVFVFAHLVINSLSDSHGSMDLIVLLNIVVSLVHYI